MEGFRYKHGDRPLEGYTIQRAVGRGGFGEVYYALSDSGREVALKVIQGYEQIELRGVSACMNLKSPYLVTIFDIRHNDAGLPFVLMEYVAGPSLRDLLNDSPSGLGEQKAAFFLREIAKGLTYLHDRGIVHRDLKPGNIFYEDGYVKIGDYGLSKAMTASQHSGQTITVGTVHYMAPEIGQGRYDRSIDVYALGIVLYEMLTGNTPYLGATPGEVLMKHMVAEPDLKGIGEPFGTALRRALAKEPTERFQTAQEMVEAIYGTEHIRNSVSHFRPESLSMAAERVARHAVVGGPGSSADHTGQLPGSPPYRDAESGTGGPMDEFGRRMDEFGERMGRMGEHIAERMTATRTRIQDRIGGHAGGAERAKPQAAANGIEPWRDPLNWNQRRVLAVITAGLLATACGFLGTMPYGDPIGIGLLAFTQILAAAGGIVAVRLRALPKLRHESGLIQRLAFAGAGCGFALLLSGLYLTGGAHLRANWGVLIMIAVGAAVGLAIRKAGLTQQHRLSGEAGPPPKLFGGRLIYLLPMVLAALAPLLGVGVLAVRYVRQALPGGGSVMRVLGSNNDVLLQTMLAGAVALVLMNWRRMTSPRRNERLSLWTAFVAGLLAWTFAQMFDGAPLLAAGILAGVALTVQVVSPWDPIAAKARQKPGEKAKESDSAVFMTSPAMAGCGGTSRENNEENVRRPARGGYAPVPRADLGYSAKPQAADGHGGTRERAIPHGRPVPVWARAIFLVLFIAAAGTGFMLLLWTGMANFRHPVDWGLGVAFGIGLLPLAAFFLVRAVGSTYHGLWSYLFRPVLMLLCCQSALCAIMIMSTEPRFDEYDMLGALAFIIFPAIIFLVVAFIRQPAVSGMTDSVVASTKHWVASMTIPADMKAPDTASTRLRLWAMLLACVGFLPIPLPLAGLHRFYAGKIGTGILWLLTGGLLGIGTIIDIILIATGNFTDKDDKPLLAWMNLDELKNMPVPRPRAAGVGMPTAEHAGRRVPFIPPNPRREESPARSESMMNNATEDDSAVAANSQAAAAYARESHANHAVPRVPQLVNPLMATLGGLLITVGFLVGLLVAVDFPAIIAAGFPDPGLAQELGRTFGYTGWPSLLSKMGVLTAACLFLAGTLLLLIARRRAGVGHVSRGMLGMLGLVLALQAAGETVCNVSWPAIVDMFNNDRVGPAIETLLDQASRRDEAAIAFAALLLVSLTMLFWPARRAVELSSFAGKEG